MGDVHIQNQQEQPILIPNSQILIPKSKQSSSSMLHQQENNDLFSMLQLNNSKQLRQNTSVKRRSPPSTIDRSSKKHSFDQEDLTRNGFSAISLPFSVCGNDLRRCVSDPCRTSEQLTPPAVRGSGLPPLPPNLRRCLSDVIPSKVKGVSRSSSSEELTPDSMRLKRMKERLKEMKQWWDEVMKEDAEEVEEEDEQEQEQEQEEKEESPVAEDEKVLSQEDELVEDFDEAVSVEWAEKCLSLTFKCPCGKGYEVLISANNCYYKLV